MKDLLELIGRSPYLWAAAITGFVLALVFLFGSTVGFFAAGGAVRCLTALIAFGCFLVFAHLTAVITLTIRPGAKRAVDADPIARGILSAGVLISSALIVHAAFG